MVERSLHDRAGGSNLDEVIKFCLDEELDSITIGRLELIRLATFSKEQVA